MDGACRRVAALSQEIGYLEVRDLLDIDKTLYLSKKLMIAKLSRVSYQHMCHSI